MGKQIHELKNRLPSLKKLITHDLLKISGQDMLVEKPQVSIIIPTYNESQNILGILKSIKENLPKNISAEAIVVDDNSPDGTGKIVEDYLKNLKKITNYTIDVIHRKTKMV